MTATKRGLECDNAEIAMENWNEEKKKDFEKLKIELKSILISSLKQEFTAKDLDENYMDLMRKPIDYMRFGFKSLDDMMRCMPDVVQYNVDPHTGRGTILAVSDVRTRHIERLVEGQRSGAPSRFGGIVSKNVIRNKIREGMVKIVRHHNCKMELNKMIDTYAKWQGDSIHGMARRAFNSSFSEALKHPSLAQYFKVTEEAGKEMIEIVTQQPRKYALNHKYQEKRPLNAGPRLQTNPHYGSISRMPNSSTPEPRQRKTNISQKVYDRDTLEAIRLRSLDRKVFVNGATSGSITVEVENFKKVEAARAKPEPEEEVDRYEADKAQICLESDVDADQFIECCIQLLQTSFPDGISIGNLMAEIEKHTGLEINWRDETIRQALTALGAQLGRFDAKRGFTFHPSSTDVVSSPSIQSTSEKEEGVAVGLLVDLSYDQEDCNQPKDREIKVNTPELQTPPNMLNDSEPDPVTNSHVLLTKQVQLMTIFRCLSDLGAHAEFRVVHEKLESHYDLSLPPKTLATIFKEMPNWFQLSYLPTGKLAVGINFGKFSEDVDLTVAGEDLNEFSGSVARNRVVVQGTPG